MKIPRVQEEFHRRPAPERDIQERGQPPGDFFAKGHEASYQFGVADIPPDSTSSVWAPSSPSSPDEEQVRQRGRAQANRTRIASTASGLPPMRPPARCGNRDGIEDLNSVANHCFKMQGRQSTLPFQHPWEHKRDAGANAYRSSESFSILIHVAGNSVDEQDHSLAVGPLPPAKLAAKPAKGPSPILTRWPGDRVILFRRQG